MGSDWDEMVFHPISSHISFTQSLAALDIHTLCLSPSLDLNHLAFRADFIYFSYSFLGNTRESIRGI